METSPIVKRKNEETYGDYRTKLLILDIYDRMQEAITGRPYETILSPPPPTPASPIPRIASWEVLRESAGRA